MYQRTKWSKLSWEDYINKFMQGRDHSRVVLAQDRKAWASLEDEGNEEKGCEVKR